MIIIKKYKNNGFGTAQFQIHSVFFDWVYLSTFFIYAYTVQFSQSKHKKQCSEPHSILQIMYFFPIEAGNYNESPFT